MTNPLDKFSRPAPPPIEQLKSKEAGAAANVNPQGVLTESTVRSMNAAMRSTPAPTRPIPGIAFGKVTTPDELFRRSTVLEVQKAVPLEVQKTVPKDTQAKIFNPTQVIDQSRQKAEIQDIPVKTITERKIELTEKTLNALTQKLEEAQANQKAISQEGRKERGKNDPAFMSNLLKSAEQVKAIKNDIQTASGILTNLRLKNLDEQIEANKKNYTQNHFELLLNKAKLEKEVAIFNQEPQDIIYKLEKNIRKLEDNAFTIVLATKETKETGQSFLKQFERFNKFTANVMEQDKNFYKSFFENKLVIENTLAKSKKFENKLNACTTTEELVKCYQSPEFIEYAEAIKKYSVIFDEINKTLPTLDLEKINKKLPDGTPGKVTAEGLANLKNELGGDAISPVQRFLKHSLLLRSILERTPKEDASDLNQSMEIVKVMADSINERSRELSTLADLKNSITNYKFQKKSPLSRMTRTFRGDAMQVGNETNTPNETKLNSMISELLSLSQSKNRETVVEAKELFEAMKAQRYIKVMIDIDESIASRIDTLNDVFAKI